MTDVLVPPPDPGRLQATFLCRLCGRQRQQAFPQQDLLMATMLVDGVSATFYGLCDRCLRSPQSKRPTSRNVGDFRATVSDAGQLARNHSTQGTNEMRTA